MSLSDASIWGVWIEEGTALAAASRWRFAADGSFTYARLQSGSSRHRRGRFRVEERSGHDVLRLELGERSSLVPVRLAGERLEMLVRAAGAKVIRSYARANTRSPELQAAAARLVGRWERADTRHDEMIGELYDFAADGSFTRVEGLHRNLVSGQATSFEQISARTGIYLLEAVDGDVRLSFDLDGRLRPAGKVLLQGDELTLDGPRPLRLLRRTGAGLRRQEAG